MARRNDPASHGHPLQGRGGRSNEPAGADAIRARIDAYAARLASTPRALKTDERRALLAELKAAGLLDVRRAMETIAAHPGVSRASVYSYAR